MKARGSLRVSPDKHYIVSMGLRSYEPSSPVLVLLTDLRNGEEQIIDTDRGGTDLNWFFDGSSFLYRTSFNYGDSANSIMSYNIEHNESTLLFKADMAKYSPVSSKIAYIANGSVYLKNLDNNQNELLISDTTVYAIEWAQNSDRYLYIVSQFVYGYPAYRLRSIDLSDYSIKEIYRSYNTEAPVPQNFTFTGNDYQFSSYIKNGEENVLIAKANPHNGNTKDSIMIYQTAYDSIRVLLEYFRKPYDISTGFFSPKWSSNGAAFTIQRGSEIIDYGCGNTIWEYSLENDSIIDFIPGWEGIYAHQYYGEFMNPVYLDSNRIAFCAWDPNNLDTYQNEIHIADRTIVDIADTIKKSINLSINNYPNPFNNSTVINYALPTAGSINLAIYNAKGELVKNLYTGHQSAGRHASTFNASGLNSGVYYTRLKYGNNTKVHKVLLVK